MYVSQIVGKKVYLHKANVSLLMSTIYYRSSFVISYNLSVTRGSYWITLLVNWNKQQLMTLNLHYSNIGQFCFYSVFRFNFTNAENKKLHCFDFNRALFQLNQNFYWLLWIIKNCNKIIKKSIIIISRENRSK